MFTLKYEMSNVNPEVTKVAKSTVISTKIDAGLKEDVTVIFKRLGFSATEAITLFYKMVKRENGLPFEAEIPNKETLQAVKEVEEDKNLVYCKDADDLFRKLEI
jgi:DNA-damage-inducible protein J